MECTWGEEKCIFCELPIHNDGSSACQCRGGRLIYRKEPSAPKSSIRIYYDTQRGEPSAPCNWQEAQRTFWELPDEKRRVWERKAEDEQRRFETEKREYNGQLELEEEILTDEEKEGDMECGNGVAQIRSDLQRRRCEQRWARYRRDYHHPQLGQSPTPVPPYTTFPHFLELPPEIRLQIYTHLFSPSTTSTDLRHWQLPYETTFDNTPELHFTYLHPLDTRILAASPLIHTEALHALYSTRTFVVDISRASTPPLFLSQSTGSLPPRPTQKIRRWHIRITFTDLIHK
ncbi:MAG: hypothetical protein Q9168_005808, partial [Polycauliona sp. 1 TL-2023]